MLFLAEMEVHLPPDMPREQADELKARDSVNVPLGI